MNNTSDQGTAERARLFADFGLGSEELIHTP